MTALVDYRPGQLADALCIGVLATHVFLDTYATQGLRPDLAREVLSACSVDAFATRLADAGRSFVLAESDAHLLAFAEFALQSAEIVRLYVHPKFHRQGVGRALCVHAEGIAAGQGADAVWLSAWSGNASALAFYQALGFQDVGATTYAIEGRHYENRVLRKVLPKD